MRHLPPRVLLLTGPVALAFFAGGFGAGPRQAALGAAALVLAILALTAPAGTLLPATRTPRTAVLALAAFAAWVACSRAWSPVPGPATDDAERVTLYALTLLCAAAAFRGRRAGRWVEPALAGGALVVVAYGLAGRMLPGLVVQHPSLTAGGRLEQPITYWNAEGALAAFGFVLCARIAGDRERPAWLRAAAAAAAGPLAAGTYLTFSRGALVALVAGLLVLLVLAPTWSQLRGAAICAEAGVAATLAGAASPAVRTLAGDAAARRDEGLLVLVAFVLVAAAGAGLARWSARAEDRRATRMGRLPLPAWAGTAVAVTVVALVAVPVLAARGGDGPSPRFGATSARFASTSSNRYEYWKVALRSFAHHPVAGVGSSGFRVQWLRERTLPERVRDAHSLELETLAELGLVGALLLALTVGGITAAARTVQRADPALAAGPAAALVVFAVHSALDWDWELPAVTLPALVLAGLLLGRAEADRLASPRRGRPGSPG